MDFKSSTIGEILDSEREMVIKGTELYGEFFVNASEFNDLLINFIKSVDDPTKFIFLAFLSQIRKHHTLALFSAVRLHHIQAGMNLRQVFEAGAWAVYAMGHADDKKFCERDPKDASWIIQVPKQLKDERDRWLNAKFQDKSDWMKNLKNIINSSVAHSNIAYVFQNFKARPIDNPGFELSFFDDFDEHKIKTDLWSIANTALGFLDLFYGANLRYKVFQFVDGFMPRFKALVAQHEALKKQMMISPRFIKAMNLSNPTST